METVTHSLFFFSKTDISAGGQAIGLKFWQLVSFNDVIKNLN